VVRSASQTSASDSVDVSERPLICSNRLELVGGAGGLAMIGLGISVAATGRKN
jgi:hypothetical protein